MSAAAQTQTQIPLIGRDFELARLTASLVRYRPLLITGPRGSGKSRLIDEAFAAVPDHVRPIRIRFEPNLHNLLVKLAHSLLQTRHRAFCARIRGCENHIAKQTSIHLRGLLWNSLLEQPRSILIEDIVNASAPAYRFLQPIYYNPGVALIATAISPDRMGFLHRLFWDPRDHLSLHPFRHYELLRLASAAEQAFQLPAEIDRADLRKKIIEISAGNPGRLIEMYKLAASPKYHTGAYIKMALIQIDLAARFSC